MTDARGTHGNRVFYLSVAPDQVSTIVRGLRTHGLVTPPGTGSGAPYQHVIVEKPFGEDIASARALNRELLSHLAESQIYRIDHYLGKETVQNLMVLRFGNTIFEPLWSRQHIDHVQVTVAEDIGVGGSRQVLRQGGNYPRHCSKPCAPDPRACRHGAPVVLGCRTAVRDEKVKVLRTLHPMRDALVRERVVRGQYGRGTVRGDTVPAYNAEPDVPAKSMTETYVAMRLELDSWRWSGVPFYLRAGKRLARRLTEVALNFKPLPHRLFRDARGASEQPNSLIMRIQPDEGISFASRPRFRAKALPCARLRWISLWDRVRVEHARGLRAPASRHDAR